MHSSGGVVAGGAEHYLEIERDWSADQPIGLPKLLCVMEVCVINSIKLLCLDTFIFIAIFSENKRKSILN